MPHQYLLGSIGGRFAENVVQFKTVSAAVEALKAGKLGAVMASRPQIEAALGEMPKTLQLAEFSGVGLDVREWDLGLAVKKENDALAKAGAESRRHAAKNLRHNGVSYQKPSLKRAQ